MNIFASLVAQHENLGDVVLRREMVRRLALHGVLHLLAKDSPEEYLQALEIPASVKLHASRRTWAVALIRSAIKGDAALVYSPGPQHLADRPKLIAGELGRIGITGALRALGNPSAKLGRSFEGTGSVTKMLAKEHGRVLALTVVRDSESLRGYSHAFVLPDLAVCAGDASPIFGGSLLAVSLRYDRGHDLRRIAAMAVSLATRMDLRPVVVLQVTRDLRASQELARLLGSPLVAAQGDISERLAAVAATYRESALVLSDRLHALVFGLTHGAAPVLIPSEHDRKVRSALSEIGIDVDSSQMLADDPFAESALVLEDMMSTAEQALNGSRARLAELDLLLTQHLRVGNRSTSEERKTHA